MSSASKPKAKPTTTTTSSKSAQKKSKPNSYSGFSDAERKAMQERAKELELEAGKGKLKGKAKMEKELLDKIAEMPEPDRAMTERTGVTRDYRERGIGTALVNRAVAAARDFGCEDLNAGGGGVKTPMMSVLEKVGFEIEPAWVTFAKVY